jgi:hypothetical protein
MISLSALAYTLDVVVITNHAPHRVTRLSAAGIPRSSRRITTTTTITTKLGQGHA